MKARRAISAALVLAALSTLMASCDNSYGFYSALQQTTKASGSSLKKTKVTDLAYFNGSYYARLTALYTRAASSEAGSEWSPVSIGTEPGTDYTCTGTTVANSKLYVATVQETFSGDTTTETHATYSTSDGSTWSAEAGFGSLNVQALYSLDGKLFAAVRTETSTSVTKYALYYLDGASAIQLSTIGDSGTLYSLPLALYHGDRDEYWFSGTASSSATASSLYVLPSSSLSGTAAWTNYDGPASCIITAMARISATGLAFGTDGGIVYSQDLSSWDSAWATKKTVNGDYEIQSLIALPEASPTVLLASIKYPNGYYVGALSSGSLGSFALENDSDTDPGVATENNFNDTMDSLRVGKFVYEPTTSTLFACVSATATSVAANYSGLYSNVYSSGSWGGWETE